MDSYNWLLICFLAFCFLSYRHIAKAFSKSIKSAQDSIFSSILDAENILSEAKAKNNESNELYNSLSLEKDKIYSEAKNQLKYEIEAKKKDFQLLIAAKKERLEDSFSRDILNLKQEIYEELVSDLKRKFLSDLKKNNNVSSAFLKKIIG